MILVNSSSLIVPFCGAAFQVRPIERIRTRESWRPRRCGACAKSQILSSLLKVCPSAHEECYSARPQRVVTGWVERVVWGPDTLLVAEISLSVDLLVMKNPVRQRAFRLRAAGPCLLPEIRVGYYLGRDRSVLVAVGSAAIADSSDVG